MKLTAIVIGFDFSSSGLWGRTKEMNDHMPFCISQDDIGLVASVSRAVQEWNDIFDYLATYEAETIDSDNKYAVSKRVANFMKPYGLRVAKMVKKELSDRVVIYHHYTDDGECEDIIIEVEND